MLNNPFILLRNGEEVYEFFTQLNKKRSFYLFENCRTLFFFYKNFTMYIVHF